MLAPIWNLGVQDLHLLPDSPVPKANFYKICRLVSLAQSGFNPLEPSMYESSLQIELPPPQFSLIKSITIPVDDIYKTTAEQRSIYIEEFNEADVGGIGFLTGSQAVPVLSKFNLHKNVLAHVWALSDVDQNGNLDATEWIIARHLIYCVINFNISLPQSLPPSLIPSHMRVGGGEVPSGLISPVTTPAKNKKDITNNTEKPFREEAKNKISAPFIPSRLSAKTTGKSP